MGHLNLLIGIRIVISKRNLRFEHKKDDTRYCGWVRICDNCIEFG